jgi:hypothetical protein
MLRLNRPERIAGKRNDDNTSRTWSHLRVLAVALILAIVPSIEAQVASAQRAIEQLEDCSKKERKGDACINILKRESAGKGKEKIKAQVRGGRIIWYEFNKKSGTVRRSN